MLSSDDVEKLRGHGLPIVGGIYPHKGRRAIAAHLLPGTREVLFGVGGGLLEIRYAPTGFLLVRAEVYRRVQEEGKLPACNAQFGRPLVPYFQPLILDTPRGPWYLGEDYAVCERARWCGFQVFADTTIRLRHYGRFGFSWEEAGSAPPRYATYRFKAEDVG